MDTLTTTQIFFALAKLLEGIEEKKATSQLFPPGTNVNVSSMDKVIKILYDSVRNTAGANEEPNTKLTESLESIENPKLLDNSNIKRSGITVSDLVNTTEDIDDDRKSPVINDTMNSTATPSTTSSDNPIKIDRNLLKRKRNNNRSRFTFDHILGGKSMSTQEKESLKPSDFCHVCRRNIRTQSLVVCSAIKYGGCRKTQCLRCFVVLDMKNCDEFTCTHCTDTCPEKSQCKTYNKINAKRFPGINKQKKRTHDFSLL